MFRAVIAGLLVGVLMGAEPAVASIVEDPVRTTQWRSTECAKGALIDAIKEPTGGVIVTGEAQECGAHVPGSFFAVATYHLRDPRYKPFAELEDARFYRQGQPRPFGVRTFFGTGTEAVCLMVSATKRIACALVTIPPIGIPTVKPLKVDDPLVAKPVELGWQDPAHSVGSDKCANCW